MRSSMTLRTVVSVGVAGLLLSAVPAAAQSTTSPAGLWDATVTVTLPNNGGTIDVPFRFEIACAGAGCTSPKGSFFNGDEKVTSTTGRFAGGALAFSFDEYGTKLDATLKSNRIEGMYSRGTRG